MASPVVLEVKILDFIENQTIHKPAIGEPDTEIMFRILHYIDEEIGGALCLTHVCLPELGSRYFDGIWTIEIDCCCNKHSEFIVNRIKNIFPPNRMN